MRKEWLEYVIEAYENALNDETFVNRGEAAVNAAENAALVIAMCYYDAKWPVDLARDPEKAKKVWALVDEILEAAGIDRQEEESYVVTEFGRTRKFPAVIAEVYEDHMIVSCPEISDHLWIDEDNMDMIEEGR